MELKRPGWLEFLESSSSLTYKQKHVHVYMDMLRFTRISQNNVKLFPISDIPSSRKAINGVI